MEEKNERFSLEVANDRASRLRTKKKELLEEEDERIESNSNYFFVTFLRVRVTRNSIQKHTNAADGLWSSSK